MRLSDIGKSTEALNARAEHVAGLRDHLGWEAVREELERKRDELTKKIVAGVADYDTYRRYCFTLEGIVFALETPQRLIDQADHGEDTTDVTD